MSFMMAPARSQQGATGEGIGMTNAGSVADVIPKGYRLGQLGRFSPQQQQLFSQLFAHVSPDSYLSKLAGGDTSSLGPSEQMAWRDYQGALGNLASRFSGMGTGSRNSSAFQNLATQSAQDFATALQQQRADLQGKALKELFEMSNMLLGQQPSEKLLVQKQQKQPSFLQQLGLGLSGGLGSMVGSKLGQLF
jgi:hypothetical protein